jgi:hypothetical protein
LISSFRIFESSLLENKPFSRELLSKLSRLGSRLKLSNSESGYKVQSAEEITCAFQLFITILSSVSLLATERLFRIATPRADSDK